MGRQAGHIVYGDPIDEILEINHLTIEAERPAVNKMTGKKIVGNA